jgi:hypothetical protein
MAAQQTAEQKAAAEKAAADVQAAALASKEAAEKRAADEKAAAEAEAARQAAQEPVVEPETPQRVVLGAAVVLALVDGGERYLYRGATVSDGYTESAIEHAESIGLIGVVK